MNLNHSQMLARLGRGESIANVRSAAGISREQFDVWWRDECQRRVPQNSEIERVDGLGGTVQITRDRRGLPHITAQSDADLFFGFGYATAQDRLFQLDYSRRKARGRLAEIIGRESIESDILSRTIDLPGIADREWAALSAEARNLLSAYTGGINALIKATRAKLPIEFDLLQYEPELWSPLDSLAIIGDFRWYLTGRFPVIVVPELVKRAVGDGPLYRAFLAGEVDGECILPPGSYPRDQRPAEAESGCSDDGPGSNNWVLSGRRTPSGLPLVASDPHVPFAAVSIWHEVHLHGGSFHVAGVALAGMPAIIIGRNEHMAWGVTNNICSQRDLYQEQTSPDHPDCFLYDGRWEPASHREEVIQVRDAEPIRQTILSSRNGPIVDHILPLPARGTGPVSVRWKGFEPCGWLTAVMDMNRARTAAAFRDSIRPWKVPTFNVVFADVDGHIGYQCSGQIPLRHVRERGYRPGWEKTHQWDGSLAFESMPHAIDPARGFLVTANNRIAPDDYPQPLSGTWVTGYRARRIREQIDSQPQMSASAHRQLQLDVFSGRAALSVPPLVACLAKDADPRVQRAANNLKSWDYHVRADSVPAAIFNVFFVHWCRAVAAERLPREAVELVSAAAGPLAVRLLGNDDLGWFVTKDRSSAILLAFRAALDELANRLGPDMDQWAWGRLHVLLQKHFLAARGDLGQLLDHKRTPMGGDGHTVNSSTPDPNYAAWLGAGFRFVAELADPQAGWRSVESGSASGHPGSPYYADQLPTWHTGELYYTPLRGRVDGSTLTLTP